MSYFTDKITSVFPKTTQTIVNFATIGDREIDPTVLEAICRLIDHPLWRSTCMHVWSISERVIRSFGLIWKVVKILVKTKETVYDPLLKMACVAALYAINPSKKGLVPLVVYLLTEIGLTVAGVIDSLMAFVLEAGAGALSKSKELSQTLLDLLKSHNVDEPLEVPTVEPCSKTWEDLILMIFMPVACKLSQLGHNTGLVLKGLEKALGSFTKMASGIRAVEFLAATIKQSFEYLCSVVYGDKELSELYEIAATRPTMEGNSTRSFTASQFVDMSILFGTAGSIDDCKNSGSKRSILNDLISAWRQIQFQHKDKKHLIVQILEPLEAIKKFVDTEKRSGSRKFEPFHISFGGDPGVGKSTILPIFVQALGSEYMLGSDPLYDYPSDTGMHSYAIPYGSKFFDGYKGQYTVLLDDICQEKCPSVEGSSANILIRMISCISNNMEGSAVEDKIVPFSSRLVMTTTNDMYPNDQTLGISTPAAFHRRRHLLFKVIESDKEDAILHRNIAFQQFSSQNPVPLGKPMTFVELLKTFKEAFTLHTRKEMSLINRDTTELDRLLKETLAVEPTCLLQLNEEQIRMAWDKAAVRIPEFSGRRRELYENTTPVLLQLSPVEGVVEHTMPCLNCPMIVPEDPSWTAHWEYYLFEILDEGSEGTITISEEDNTITISDDEVYTVSDDEYNPDDDDGMMQLINNTIRMYTETNPMTPIEALIGTSHNNNLPFFRCDGVDLDESTVDNKPLMALQFLKGLITLEFQLVVQGKMLDINPVASVSRAVGIIQQLGLNEADIDKDFLRECQFPEFLPRYGTHRIDCTLVPWIPNDSKEVKRMRSCRPGDWWSVVPCGLELAPLKVIYMWRSFKQFVQDHYRKLMLTALIIPAAIIIWDKVVSRLEPTYIGSGVGRVSNYETPRPTDGAIKRSKWAVVVTVGLGTGSGFMLHGRSFITSRHSFPAREGDVVKLNLHNKVYEEVFNPSKLYISQTGDFVIYTMTNTQVPLAPNSIGSLFTSSDPKKINLECILGFSNMIHEASGSLCSRQISYTTQNITYQPEAAYVLDGSVMLGDSGSIVIDKARQQLFGMVVARGKNIFYVERFPVAEIKNYFNEKVEATSLNMPFLRKAEQPIPQMSKTKLTASGLFNFLTAICYYKPAKLRSSDPNVDLLTKSMSGYDHSFATLDTDISDQIVEEFRSHDLQRRSKVPRRVLTFSESLNGIHELKPFEISTSPGLPWKLMPINQGVSGKRAFISGDCPNRVSPLWEKACETFDFDSPILGYACLKDELRPIASVEAEKTRSFIVLPADYNLKLRQYFGSFVASQHARAGHESSCVGINPYESWDLIYSRLSRMNQEWEDFDYTEWDRTLSPDWFIMYADRVSNWYDDGEENRQRRRKLMNQLVFSQVQIGADIFQLYGGNKSGCSITAEINTDIHQMLMAYTWIKLAKIHDPAKANVLSMFQHNEFVFYGDDQVKSTDPSISWFNGNTIEPIMVELGMKITPGNKTDTEFFPKPPSEITFLKRGFGNRSCAGKLACPLSEKSISKMLYYVHKSDNLQGATQLNMETACKEMFFHGKEKYDRFISELVQVVQANNLDFEIPTRRWEDLERDWVFGHMVAPSYW